MNPFPKRLLPWALCLTLSMPAWGQGSITEILQPSAETSKASESAPADPLGRQTPNGTLFGFLQAVQAENYPKAALYLQLSPARRDALGEKLAIELKTALDRAFVGSLRSISSSPDGGLSGVISDRLKIGSLSADDIEADVVLVRLNDPVTGKIWLFSSDTLAKVPEIYDLVQAHQVETHVPAPLVKIQFLGMSLWLWLALLLAVPVSAGIGWLLMELFVYPRVLWRRFRKLPQLTMWKHVSAPVLLVIGTMVHRILVGYLRLPLLHRHYYYMVARVILIIALAWLVLRLLARGMDRLRDRAIARGSTGTGSLVLLGQRIVKVVVVIFAALTVLGVLGFNMTTALAGLGIGGLAIGFGAQKTIENLFGGVSLLGDEVIRVGDTCNFGGRVGTVEDISLRSTRIRTVERTQLSIPNGSLATMNVENLTRRDKILFNPKLNLRYETTPDQLRYVLAQARRLLYEHPKIETASARVRLAAFSDSWLTLEIFGYVLTRDFAEFTAIQEDVLLRLMDIVGEAGSDFAFPSQTVYLGRDHGLQKEKAEHAAEEVRKWREEGQLPFPDFAPTDVSDFRDSLPYPPPESAVSKVKR
jgi:MscS family membrane protein